MHNNKKHVAIILVNWNSYTVTSDCITSLSGANSQNFDVIVVDNGSMDNSGDALLAAHPHIILLKNDINTGFTGGNNRGLIYAIENSYTYAMLLNNDTFVEPDFLDPLIQYMDEHPEVGVIQSRIFFNHKRHLLWSGGSYYNKFLGFTYTKGILQRSGPKYETIKEVDWVTGCTFFTRTSILQDVGLLAENFFIYYEDVDLSLRIKQAGYKLIYHPASVVYHIAGESGKSKMKGKEGYLSPRVHYLNHRNKIWFLKKYTPWYFVPPVILANLFYVTAVIAYFAARFRFQKLRAFYKSIIDGLSGSIKYQ